MEVEIRLGRKGRRSLREFFRGETDESQGFSLHLDEKVLDLLAKRISYLPGVKEAKTHFGELSGAFPIGVIVSGRFNPSDVYNLVTRSYPIIRSKIKC